MFVPHLAHFHVNSAGSSLTSWHQGAKQSLRTEQKWTRLSSITRWVLTSAQCLMHHGRGRREELGRSLGRWLLLSSSWELSSSAMLMKGEESMTVFSWPSQPKWESGKKMCGLRNTQSLKTAVENTSGYRKGSSGRGFEWRLGLTPQRETNLQKTSWGRNPAAPMMHHEYNFTNPMSTTLIIWPYCILR